MPARRLRRAAISADPAGAEQRHRRAHADRRVEAFPDEDGMTGVWAWLAAPHTTAVMLGLSGHARKARAGGDPRTMDQLRADILTDRLIGLLDDPDLPARHGAKPAINVTVSWATLAGLDERPAHLAGYGPITAPTARRLAADGSWRRLLTDPVDRQLLHLGRTRYKPTAALAEFTTIRDQVCTWPHCNRPAGDFDHAHPWAKGGLTDPDNGHRPCPYHHHTRDHGGWQVTRLPASRTQWTSPTGHTYTTRPPSLDDP